MTLTTTITPTTTTMTANNYEDDDEVHLFRLELNVSLNVCLSRFGPCTWGRAQLSETKPTRDGERLTEGPRSKQRASPLAHPETSEKSRHRRQKPGDNVDFSVEGPCHPAYWALLILEAGDVEPNPGPTNCPICNKEFIEGKQAAVWCHLGGWVHLKCTYL